MAQTMTASARDQMTDGQLENAVAKFRDALRKHRDEFGSDAVQQVLGIGNLGMELLASFRTRVEAVSNLIVRRVKPNRSRTPQGMLDATGRRQYTDNVVVKTMPKGKGDEVKVIFFKEGRYLSDDQLEERFAFHGLKPADPYSLAAVNEADPAFADDHPNGTHWKDARDNWCFAAFRRFATFRRWDDERGVCVRRRDGGWGGDWWFAGVRK